MTGHVPVCHCDTRAHLATGSRVCVCLGGGGASREDKYHSGRDASVDANGGAVEKPLQSREAEEPGSEKRQVQVQRWVVV